MISAYPITPQTVVVERLSEMVEDGSLAAEYVHVESEHSALSCAIGASATGARTFTATSSQGLLYMAECLTYAAGGRFPIVMMNANRATALPWNIYGDQRDSLALLDHGWIQVYAEDNQEALDLALMAYAVAENPAVATPVNIVFSAGPEYNRYFKYWEHRDMLDAPAVVTQVEQRFAEVFGRQYPGMIETLDCDDADVILVTLGSAAGLVRSVVWQLRDQGVRAGMLRIRYLRPMPSALIAEALRGAKAVGVLEKDVSFGAEGTVFTNVNSALQQAAVGVPTYNFVGGLGGDDISETQVHGMYRMLVQAAEGTGELPRVSFLGIDSPADALGAERGR